MADVEEKTVLETGEGEPAPEKAVEGGPSFDWKAGIHPDVASHEVWKSVPDLATLTKSYVEKLKEPEGAVRIPGADATPEERAKFFDKLGRPASPEGYLNVGEKDDRPEFTQAMKGVAHSAGITGEQWQVLASGFNRLEAERVRASQEAAGVTTEALKAEWGGAYTKHLTLAQRAIQTMGGPDLFTDIVSSGLGNNAGFIRMMAKVGGQLVEKSVLPGDVSGMPTKASAQEEIDTLTVSPAYLQAGHPGHKAAMERAKYLFQYLYN